MIRQSLSFRSDGVTDPRPKTPFNMAVLSALAVRGQSWQDLRCLGADFARETSPAKGFVS